MYDPIDNGQHYSQFDQPFVENFYSNGYYQQNDCLQNGMVNTFLNDLNNFGYTDNNNNFYSPRLDTDSYFKPIEAPSPPPTPDIITTFSMFPQDNTSSYSTTPEVYQNLSSPPLYSEQSPCSLSIASPASSTSTSTSTLALPSPLTMNETKTHLIKDTLRLTIQSKRVAKGLDEISSSELSPSGRDSVDNTLQLTKEDEDRRRRRKERNKVAAAKCRNKKKLHSINLDHEFKILEASNEMLKKEIFDLQKECQQLATVLESHRNQCTAKHLRIKTSIEIDEFNIDGQCYKCPCTF